MKITTTTLMLTIITFVASLNYAKGQNIEIEGGVKISDLPNTSVPETVVTVNPDSTLSSASISTLIQKLNFERLNNEYKFTDITGVEHVLLLTNTTSNHGGVSGINPNTHIAFIAGGATDSYLLFNIEGANEACKVFHVEDDNPVPGMYTASDSGNSGVNISAWGNSTTQTFMIRFEGNTGHVLPNHTSFALVCF